MSPARWLRAFLRFWLDFLVGEDWLVAAGVALALLATWGLVAAGVSAWWLLPPAVVLAIATSLRRAVRRER